MGIDGIEDQENTLTLYPNPVKEIITIDSKITVAKVEIYSILGKRVLETKETLKINVSHLEQGLYLLKIYSQKGIITKKIIKN